MWNKINNISIICGIVIVALIFCEAFAYLYLDIKESNKLTQFNFRSNKPEAYLNSPYFSKRFIAESLGTGGIFFTPENSRLILSKDYSGNYINVKNGFRQTYPKIDGIKKIYIYGGSTIFSGEVPDYYTIPSLLSELLLRNKVKEYQVINMGVTSVNTNQQLLSLYNTNIKKGDIVFFYSGVNDILQGLYFGNPDGTIIGQQIQNRTKNAENNYKKFLVNFNIFNFLLSLSSEAYIPTHLKNKEEVKLLQEKIKNNYIDNIIKAHDYTRQGGGIFINVLQPNLYSKNNNSNYEKRVDKDITFKGLKNAFILGNNSLELAHASLLKSGINSKNYSKLFDKSAEECFLDGYHTTEFCNLAVAQELFSIIISNSENFNGREFLDSVHKDYVFKNSKSFLYEINKNKKINLVRNIKSLSSSAEYFGKFDKILLEKNKLKNGYFGFLINNIKNYYISIEIECQNTGFFSVANSSFVTLGSENSVHKFSERIPLSCGKNEFNRMIDFEPTTNGIVIEAENEIFIKDISIYQI